jgi:hypothetical protein
MKKVLIMCIVLVVGVFVGIGIYKLLDMDKNIDGYYLVTEKLTLKQAEEECKYILITEDEKELLKSVSIIPDIKNAMESNELKSFSTDISKGLFKIDLSELTVVNKSIYISYILDDSRIMLNYFFDGTINKHVSKIAESGEKIGDNQFLPMFINSYEGYMNYNNNYYQREMMHPK